jgi:hypothetical protein
MYFLKPIYVLPKTIWIYWDSLEQPDLIKAIIKYNRSKTNGWDVKILNKNTIYNYVDKNDLPSSFNTLIVQHQADWYRLYLLKMYGGCWLDSSITYLTKPIIEKANYLDL